MNFDAGQLNLFTRDFRSNESSKIQFYTFLYVYCTVKLYFQTIIVYSFVEKMMSLDYYLSVPIAEMSYFKQYKFTNFDVIKLSLLIQVSSPS